MKIHLRAKADSFHSSNTQPVHVGERGESVDSRMVGLSVLFFPQPTAFEALDDLICTRRLIRLLKIDQRISQLLEPLQLLGLSQRESSLLFEV